MAERAVLVFDVNETLLDLGALDPFFTRLFGDPHARREWFDLVLRNAMTLTIAGGDADFGAVGAAALDMMFDSRGRAPTVGTADELGAAMMSLPPHPEARAALERLAGAGFTLAALTNSTSATAKAQLEASGLAPLFAHIMSVDAVGRFKPAPEVYEMAARRLDEPAHALTMVAAHDWDVAGAMWAGWRGVLVVRRGKTRNPLYPPPDLVATDLADVAEQLIAGGGET
jgi:2-haloacid dehalogenase